VVTHHPFDLPVGQNERDILGRAGMALKELSDCGVDMFLAGHLHVSQVGHPKIRYNLAGQMSLVIQAGTASSTRSRGEVNSYNVIRAAHSEIAIERMAWHPSQTAFALSGIDRFRRSGGGWSRV
jgi:3',5'-cyclic AMP phosphodiesterase CpdA